MNVVIEMGLPLLVCAAIAALVLRGFHTGALSRWIRGNASSADGGGQDAGTAQGEGAWMPASGMQPVLRLSVLLAVIMLVIWLVVRGVM